MPKAWYPTHQLRHDVFLMDVFSKRFSSTTLQILNRCRLRLKVLTISDIVHSDGITLCTEMLSGQSCSSRISCINWPNQGPIVPKYWKIWKKSIISTFCIPGTLQLQTTLGHWYQPHLLHDRFLTVLNPSCQILYQYDLPLDRWHEFCFVPSNTPLVYSKKSQRSSSGPPKYFRRVTVRSETNSSIILYSSSQLVTSTRPLKIYNFPACDYTNFLERVLERYVTYGSSNMLAHHISLGWASCASDGSLRHGKMGGSWIVTTSDMQHAIEGVAPIDGSVEEASSTRAERGALIGPLVAIYCLSMKYEINDCSIDFYIDNTNAPPISFLSYNLGPNHHLIPDYDLQ